MFGQPNDITTKAEELESEVVDIDNFDKISEVSFNSNEKEFIEVISWDTESNESDLNLDDENYRMFNKYKDKYMLDDDGS